MVFRKIVLGSDHAGFALKSVLLEFIENSGWSYEDFGAFRGDLSVDYPDFVPPVVQAVRNSEQTCGVLICRSGVGMSITANRFPGVRAALCHEPLSAQLARQHNDANILVLGGGLIGTQMARMCLIEFIVTAFEEGRHRCRLEKLEALTDISLGTPCGAQGRVAPVDSIGSGSYGGK